MTITLFSSVRLLLKTTCLITLFSATSFATDVNGKTVSTKEMEMPKNVQNIEIWGDVEIILTEALRDKMVVMGNEKSVKRAYTRLTAGKLHINAAASDYTKPTKIYLPAAMLKTIRINGDAQIYTEGLINNTELTVVLNGCSVLNIISMGKVIVQTTEAYELEG